MYPVTSSVELYGADGRLVSRFAFNLPEDLTAVPRSDEETCDWAIYEEVSPFFAEERRILHAGRALVRRQRPRPPARSSSTRCSTTRTCRSSRRRTRTSSCCGPPIRSAARASPGATSSSRSTAGAGRRSMRPTSPRGRSTMPCSAAIEQSRDAVLGRAAQGRQPLRRLSAQRPRRHLRARLPDRVAARSPRQPRRADGRSPGARISCSWPSPRCIGAFSRRGDDGARAAARDPRQLLPQAVPRLRRRDRSCRSWRWRSPRATTSPTRCAPTSSRRRSAPRRRPAASSKTSSRRARRSRALASTTTCGLGQPADRPGRQHLQRRRGCWRPASATCLRQACCRRARRPTSTARSSCENERHDRRARAGRHAELPRGGHVDGRSRARRDADRAADVARAADRRADRHARSARAARRAASSSSAAPASATGWPSALPTR